MFFVRILSNQAVYIQQVALPVNFWDEAKGNSAPPPPAPEPVEDSILRYRQDGRWDAPILGMDEEVAALNLERQKAYETRKKKKQSENPRQRRPRGKGKKATRKVLGGHGDRAMTVVQARTGRRRQHDVRVAVLDISAL